MEHSYSKDIHPKGNVEVMATRNILIPRPPQCPSCHQHSSNDDILAKLESQQTDPYFDQLPPALNDNIAKMAMDETDRLTKNVKNCNPDDEDWDLKVNKFGWSKQQSNLYRQVSTILDYDHLARLAVNGRPNEGIIRRCSIDKSVARMRLALASVHWDVRLTQWLHTVMSDHLPPTYMASYLDILQTLRTKVPTLVDKMLATRPPSFNQDYMQAVNKRPWGANVPTKSRKLPGHSPIIVIVPATLNVYSINQQPSSRMKRWFSLLGTMASIAPIQNTVRNSQSLDNITEQLISITRSKIQDLRNEMPNRHIILVGINTGASVALQVALVESVSSVICMGFAFNTLKGVRGQPDDRILEITIPVLFVLGENSSRSSQEEIESLRERMVAQTSLVVVGSADDALRIRKFNRHLEGVTQSMVDNMIADEIQDFASTCIINPPGPRELSNNLNKRSIGAISSKKHETKKRKHKDSVSKVDKGTPRKVGRPRLNRSNEVPTGNLKPEKPKQAQALLKQNTESIKLVTQNVGQYTEISSPSKEISNASESPKTSESVENPDISLQTMGDKPADVQTPITNISSCAQSPETGTKSTNQFIQIKPPTTTGRIQSPNMKNFFIRKGIEKQSPAAPNILTTSGTISPVISSTQLTGNKKIVIKSQQILVPATNIKQSPNIVSTSITQQNSSLAVVNTVDSIDTSSSDLSGILDLPILFADNETTIIEQSEQILNTSGTSSTTQIANVSNDTPQTNILITSPEGKLPNRPVVISAAKIGKSVNPSSNKVIFINRNQIKPQIVTSHTVSPAPIVKGIPTLKLVPTSLSNQVTPITFSNNLTKLAPGTKIDLSQLKIVKNVSQTAQSGVAKPIIINKPAVINAQQGTKNAILIKPTTTTTTSTQGTANVQTHPVIKANIINRNITVRKVLNVPNTKSPAPISVSSASPTSSTTTESAAPSKTSSSPRALRKAKTSNN